MELSLSEFSEIRDMILVDTPHKLSRKLPGDNDAGQPFLDANMNLGDRQRDVKKRMLPCTDVDKKDIIGGGVSSSSSSPLTEEKNQSLSL
jgi:hypothetical protein